MEMAKKDSVPVAMGPPATQHSGIIGYGAGPMNGWPGAARGVDNFVKNIPKPVSWQTLEWRRAAGLVHWFFEKSL